MGKSKEMSRIWLTPECKRTIKINAAKKGMSMQDYLMQQFSDNKETPSLFSEQKTNKQKFPFNF